MADLAKLNLAEILDRKTGHRIDVAVHQQDVVKWGCPHCGYRSHRMHVSAHGSAAMSCGECGKGFVMTIDEEEDIKFEANTVYMLITHPRIGIPSHGRPDERPENGGEYFGSRGLGLDRTPGCFMCGGKDGMRHNISGFVRCKDSGERVVKMFKTGARLDYRDYEPDYVQVKIGACDSHLANLKKLHKLTEEADGVITPEIRAKAGS